MPLEAIQRIIKNIRNYVTSTEREAVTFVWHGGEPLLVPIDYYEGIVHLQRQIFGGNVTIHNHVQTNLTVLSERLLDFLKSGTLFSAIGVSFDVYGDQRVDLRGRLRTETVLRNMQKLLDHRIPFGAITVLARNTLPHIKNIYDFFDSLQIEFRFLPFYLSASEKQIIDHALTYDEIVSSLKLVFDVWLSSTHATPVLPIDDYIDYAIAHISGRHDQFYNRELDECIFVVDVDGGVWGADEIYGSEFKYGELRGDSLDAILFSTNRQRAVERAKRRMTDHCKQCSYFGACPGYFVGDASPQVQQILSESGCVVRPVLDHIVTTLERTKVSDMIHRRVGREGKGRSVPALSL